MLFTRHCESSLNGHSWELTTSVEYKDKQRFPTSYPRFNYSSHIHWPTKNFSNHQVGWISQKNCQLCGGKGNWKRLPARKVGQAEEKGRLPKDMVHQNDESKYCSIRGFVYNH